jgi:2-keto-4-pentenoate hydratase/2-oxohepta-3-ene-1,7-dioic acid hydratase in catechol pathway
VKVVTYSQAGEARLGFVAGETVIDALAALPGSDVPERAYFASALSFIRSGDAGRQAARRLIGDAPAAARKPLASVQLVAPLLPSTILCSGSNYHDHNKEKAAAPISGKEPEFFVKTADCVIGPGDAIVYDEVLTRKLDAETELAIVIGTAGRHIPVERALEHVFGYTIVNDVTARDRQIGDPQKLRLRTRINGELRQSSSTGNMIWSCAELIHFFSINLTLRPGMVIITGTPGGTAWSVDPELGGKWVGGDGSEPLVAAKGYLRPGDAIECELEKIGVLRNRVDTATA